METSAKIYVAGHKGLVGSALVRRLKAGGYNRLVTRTSKALDLRRQGAVEHFFDSERPDYVFLAAARVGGIHANNSAPATFLFDNLQIQNSVIDAARRYNVKKLLFLGSSCIYPRDCPQPIREEYLLTGPLEKTNEWYAVAKIAGIKLCQAYRRQYGFNGISVMPTNLYGPNDNFDLETSHVLPALIRKFHEAKVTGAPAVTVWGTGKPMREFLYADDLADACVFLMNSYEDENIVNIGAGKDISIADLARMIKNITGYQGELRFDTSKPDGTPRKLLDVSRINQLGWQCRTLLAEGIKHTYEWYLQSLQHVQELPLQPVRPPVRRDIYKAYE